MSALTSAEMRKIRERRRASARDAAEAKTPREGHREPPGWVGPLMAALAVGAIYLVARFLGFDLP